MASSWVPRLARCLSPKPLLLSPFPRTLFTPSRMLSISSRASSFTTITRPPRSFTFRSFSTEPSIVDENTTVDPLSGAVTPPPVFDNSDLPRKKKTKKQREAEMKKEKESPEQQEFNEFKNRVQLARLRGEQGEKDMEAELDKLGANGMTDYNKRICDRSINEIYDVLYPYGFHSVWLYKVCRKWAGDELTCAYLLKNKGKNWYIFAPRRQINLWQECVEDFIAGPLVGEKVTVTNVLDLLKTYYMDIEERKQYTFLEEMIEPPPVKDFQKLVKTCADNIQDEDNLAFFYTKFVRDYPTAIPMLTGTQIHDLLKECIDRLIDSLNIKNLQQEIVNNEKLRGMEEVMVLVPEGMEPKRRYEESPEGENPDAEPGAATASTESASISEVKKEETSAPAASEPKKEENASAAATTTETKSS